MNLEGWKQKYLKQLDDSEHMLREWERERYSLQRLLVRTSLVAEGQDPALDRQLGELRDLARQETPDLDQLQQLQKQLDQQVKSFEDSHRETIAGIAQALELFTGLFREQAQGAQKKALKQFQQTLPQRVGQFSELPALLSELADLQQQIFHQGQGDERRPFLKRLLGRQSAQEPVAPEPVAQPADSATPGPDSLDLEAGSDLSGAVADLGVSGKHPGDAGVAALADRLTRLLEQLLSQPGFNPATRERMEALDRRARSARDWQAISLILDELSQLILQAIGQGQQEFAGFLATLEERLALIQSQFQGQALDPQHWRDEAEQFDRALHSGLDTLGADVAAATELASLQRTTRAHLERLNTTLSEYRESQSRRETELSSHVATLQQRITAMEEESRAMHQALKDERIRATTDLLTQLPNRDALEARMEQEFSRWQRYRQRTSLALVDIDLFKQVNDVYGHLAGDKVLQLVARCIRESLRAPDFVARYGGEEFVVLLPETSGADAMAVLDKVRQKVAQLPFHFRQEKVQVTFSGGVVAFQPVENLSELFDIADRALYQAKDQGRNRIVLANDSHRRSSGRSVAQ
ncbi:MAG: GGDEF domain-containing protein [Oleiphilaceae bacterium]|nr:GGDEF domain-containing protein [Oleiphilaceae bacterium]